MKTMLELLTFLLKCDTEALSSSRISSRSWRLQVRACLSHLVKLLLPLTAEATSKRDT